MTMPLLTNPTVTTHDDVPTRSGAPFRVRLAAALASDSRDARPFAFAGRASEPTHRYRSMA
jgi:hypothetical protein